MWSSENKLGLLGLGNRTTLFYISQLNKTFNKKFGEYSTCPFKLLNADFNDLNPYLPNNFDVLEGVLESYINEIIGMGVNIVLIPNITLHETWDRIKIKLSQKFQIVHAIQNTIEQIKSNGERETVILGSNYTMNSPTIKKSFLAHNIKLIEPKKEEQLFLDHFRTLMYDEKETEKDINLFNGIVLKYSERHAVIIACTELSIPLCLSKNVYDMARIQIGSALKLLID